MSTRTWERVIDTPDDLEVRLRYADVIEGGKPDLAAYIRCGVALARMTPRPSDPAFRRTWRDEQRLYRAARPDLLARVGDWLSTPVCHGGLVEGGSADAADFLAQASSRLRQLPLRHLILTDARGCLDALLAQPWLEQLVSLELPAAHLDDSDARLLAGADLSGLRWLGLADNDIGRSGVEALARSPFLRDLQVVDLRNNPAPALGREPWLDAGEVIGFQRNPWAEALAAAHGSRPWLGRTDEVTPERTHL